MDLIDYYPHTIRLEKIISGLEFNKKYWPHQMFIESWRTAVLAERWCHANFKGRNWRSVGNKFVFKRGQDATMFALRWAQ